MINEAHDTVKTKLIIIDDYAYQLDYNFYNSISSDKLKIHPIRFGFHIPMEDYLPNNLNDFDVIVILNDVGFEDSLYSISRHARRIYSDQQLENFVDINNFKLYFKSLPTNTKYIYLDNNGEASPINEIELNNWLNLNSITTYLISSRFYNLKHDNATTGLAYLPILYMFTQQNFSQFPMLNYSPPSNPKYDFITYLGQTEKEKNISNRFYLLNKIFKNNLNGIKYKDDSQFKVSEELFGAGKPGHYWNILNSLSAKIQIIFETYSHRELSKMGELDYSEYFFTEKIMKCFILPHPYLLIINKYWLNILETFGFKFHESSKADTIEDFQNIIDTIKMDPDKWILENKLCFEHNQLNLYQMHKSIELPHHIVLKNLLLN
jgi:hypothetical protein